MLVVWMTIVFIILGCLTVLLLFVKPKVSHIESFAADSFQDKYLSFGDRQYSYFHDTIDDGLPINPGIDYHTLPDTLRNANIFVPSTASQTKRLTDRLFVDKTNNYLDYEREFCRTVSHPSKLPKRPKGATIACGWWFQEDITVPSVGTLGSRDKPTFPDTLPAGGEWIWDIPTAIMKEDIKRCKQIKSCTNIDIKDIKGKCGFCSNVGHAIPIKPNGTELYPNAHTCDTPLVLSSSNCPRNSVAAVRTPDGREIGTLGRPSEDNTLRLYTKKECDTIDPSATLTPSGECVKPGGGSYSLDYKDLNAPRNVPSVCDPDAKGTLSRACLLSICKGMGYTQAGAIMALLADAKRTPSEMDTLAIHILNSIGVVIPNALLGDGDIDEASAKSLYYKIILVTQTAKLDIYREAAKWLLYGTTRFDPCEIPDSTRGPFFPQCIQREFRKAGCQPAGSLYPKTFQQLGAYNDSKWSEVRTAFRDLHARTKDSKGEIQDKAVQQCLGIRVHRAPPPSCPPIYGTWTSNDGTMLNVSKSGTKTIIASPTWSGQLVNYDGKTKKGTFGVQVLKNKKPVNQLFKFTVRNENEFIYTNANGITNVAKRMY